MSKSLEALKTIKQELCSGCEHECCNCPYSTELLTIEEEVKALEIIRNKPQHELAQIQWKKVNTYEEYEKIVYSWDSEYWDMIYTKEEFDLLKEVLL